MADDEYYLDERPGEGSGQWKPGGGDGGGSGGGSGGSGGGSGGSGGGGRWDYWWDDPDGGDGGDDDQPGGGKPEWPDDESSAPFLRLDNQGFLRLDPVGRILRGTRSCYIASSLIVFLAKDARTHSRCVLCKSSAPERMITLKSASDFLYEDFEPRPGTALDAQNVAPRVSPAPRLLVGRHAGGDNRDQRCRGTQSVDRRP